MLKTTAVKEYYTEVLVMFTCNGSNKLPTVVASSVLLQRAVSFRREIV